MDDMASGFDTTRRALEARLVELESTHRELDELIAELHTESADMLRLQRLKRRKLQIKDEIWRVRAQIFPNISA